MKKKAEHILDFLAYNSEHNLGLTKFMDKKGNYTTYSHQELFNIGKKYANYYLSIGVKEDEVISIMLPTGIDLLGAFLGAQFIKAVPTFLYPPISLSDINKWLQSTNKMMGEVNSKILITDALIYSVMNRGDVTILDSQIRLTTESKSHLEDFEYIAKNYSANSLCFLQFSSGTTGSPKAVKITQKNVISNVEAMYKKFGIDGTSFKGVSWLPIYHDMGLVGSFLGSIIHATEATFIRPDDFIRKPYLWLKAISDQKANITVAPNFAYGLCVKRTPPEMLESLDLSSLEIALCGAEFIHKSTMDKFNETFSQCGLSESALTPVYGMAEATLGVTFSDMTRPVLFKTFDRQWLSKSIAKESTSGVTICSVGRPLEDMQVKIKNTKNKELIHGQIGEIYVSGPSVTTGYYKNIEKTNKTIINNELKTGDQGFIFEDELYICGRSKETLVIRGRNYYPTSFEEKIFKIEGIREGRVIVTSKLCSETDTEEVLVLAEVKNAKLIKDLESSMKSQIQKSFENSGLAPKDIVLLPPGFLPKTTSGKLKRKEALAILELSAIDHDQKIRSSYFSEFFSKTMFLLDHSFLRVKILIADLKN